MNRFSPFLFLAVVFCAVLAAGCAPHGGSVLVSGDASGVLESFGPGAVIDSVSIDGLGTFGVSENRFSASGKVSEPVLASVTYWLTVPGGSGNFRGMLVLEPGRIATENGIDFHGTRSNDAARHEAEVLLSGLPEDDAAMESVKKFSKRYGPQAAGLLLLNLFQSGIDEETWMGLFDNSDEEVRSIAAVKSCYERITRNSAIRAAQARTAEGMPFADFSGTWDGQEFRLSDFVGKGNFVLVDFWASWCMPCREVIPSLTDLADRYCGKGLEIIGVAVSDKPEDTHAAAASLRINYTVFNEKGRSASDAYGIQFIPLLVLIAPDGTIIKRGRSFEEISHCISDIL